jgi:2-dehydro-3-deoxyphosphogluconate aldolase / (4S)-4-hydroxy-2-oxoglutarate aldolase
MAKREDALTTILRTKIIAVIRMSDAEKIFRVADALMAGGIHAVEITLTTPGAVSIIRTLAGQKSGDILIGAGTVLDGGTAEAVIHSGADFVVSPIMSPEVIRVCRGYGTLVAAGGLTPTEIVAAWNEGADIVKVFPASGGPSYFKDLRGPFPNIRLMPTGGVGLENAAEFIRSGACCVAVGTALLDKRLIDKNEWGALTEKALQLVESLSHV